MDKRIIRKDHSKGCGSFLLQHSAASAGRLWGYLLVFPNYTASALPSCHPAAKTQPQLA